MNFSVRSEVFAENYCVVVRPVELVTVFPTGVEAYWLLKFEAQAFHELLEISQDESRARGHMFVVVSERNEARSAMEFCFVHTAQCPLARTFDPTANALTARNRDGEIDEAMLWAKGQGAFAALVGYLTLVAR